MNRVLEASQTDALHALRRQQPDVVTLLRPVWLDAEKRECPAGLPIVPRRAGGFDRPFAVVSTARLAAAALIGSRPQFAALSHTARRIGPAPLLGRNRAAEKPQSPAARNGKRAVPPEAGQVFRSAAVLTGPACRRLEQPRGDRASAVPVLPARKGDGAPAARSGMPFAGGIVPQNNALAPAEAEPRVAQGITFRGVSRESRALALPRRRTPLGRLHAPAAPFLPARYDPAAGPAERRDTGNVPVIAWAADVPFEPNQAEPSCRLESAQPRRRLAVVRRTESGPRAESAPPLPRRAPFLPHPGYRAHCAGSLPAPDRLNSLACEAATPRPGARAGFGAVPWSSAAILPPQRRTAPAGTVASAPVRTMPREIAGPQPGTPRPCAAERWRDARAALPRSFSAIKAAAFALSGAGPRAVPALTSNVASKNRAASVPFNSELLEFKTVQFNIQGTVAGAMEDEVRLEENFASGLSQWAGGSDDWKLDAAGVRIGSLALFAPSLGLRDYQLEFLAKIEKRTVAWVFRAANLENYYLFKLAVQGTGSTRTLQLTRCAVIAGAAGAAETVPVPIEVRSKASFRVQVSVAGQDFTTSVEGQTIDRWNDARLETGGIGFLAEQDDRSRLYWVKLSSSGQPS